MITLRKIVVFCCLLFIVWDTAAQPPAHARRLYDKAMNFRARNKPDKAFSALHRAIKIYPRYEDAYVALGAWYSGSHRFREAAEVYQQASFNCPNGHTTYAGLLATALLRDGQVNQAHYVGQKYGSEGIEWQQLRNRIDFVRRAIANGWAAEAQNMGIRVNTPFAEMFPTISADGEILYYTRRTHGIDDDLYFSRRDSCGGWFSGEPFPYPVNTSGQEAAAMISADKHYLFFMRCDNRSITGWDNGSCDLYMAYTADSIWSAPQGFGATINTPGYEGMPNLSPDNRELYFASDREGGYGGTDIWMSRFEGGLWQAPRNLGPEINTPGNESAPFLHADNKTLLFASDGHPGMGGTDLFISRRTSDTIWTAAHNLGYPVNSTADEASISLSADGKKGYLSSNRQNLEGNYDLFEIDWPEALQPERISFITGRVYDSFSKYSLNYASIFIHDIQGRELAHYTSNRGDGSFMVIMPIHTRFIMSVHRFGYQSISDTLQYTEQFLAQPAEYHAALLPNDYREPVDDSLALSVYFKINQTTLTDSLKQVIGEKLYHWLPGDDLLIQINGYTDNTGTPLVNEQVSHMRAQAVADALIETGFNPAVILARGWGEVNPAADNQTDTGRDQNRRVEIVIRR